MKATKIYYKKLINLGNYENEEIGIEIELEDNVTAKMALDSARIFVENNSNSIEKNILNKKYQNILTNKHNHTYIEVEEAIHYFEGRDHDKETSIL